MMETDSGPRTIYLLKQVELLFRTKAELALRATPVTLAQYTILSLATRHPGASSAELARRLGITPQSTNELVVKLVAMNLIRRVADKPGQRNLSIYLTAAGKTLTDHCDSLITTIENELFSTLSDDRKSLLSTALRDILRSSRKLF